MTGLSQTQRPICATCGKPFRDMRTNIHLGVEDAEHREHIFAAPEETMSDATKAGDTQREAFEKWFRALPDTFFGYDYETAWAAWRERTAHAARDKDAAVAAAEEIGFRAATKMLCIRCRRGEPIVDRKAAYVKHEKGPCMAHKLQRFTGRDALKAHDAEVAKPLVEALKLALVRLEILQGRMAVCEEDGEPSHNVSAIEIPGWLEEYRALLARYAAHTDEGEGEKYG
jgi:hypothetical protein